MLPFKVTTHAFLKAMSGNMVLIEQSSLSLYEHTAQFVRR